MAPGTTLAAPVAVDHKPDLESSIYEISEYLEKQQAYDLFDYLLRDMLVTQPADPLQHMIDCLKVQVPSGPLQVFVCGPSGAGRSQQCKDLAAKFGLAHISAGELLRSQLGVDTKKLDSADDKDVSKVVIEAVQQAKSKMQGFVLDGFPRTRIQTSMLQEHAIVPTHVLVLKATRDQVVERQNQIADGTATGDYVDPKTLEAKVNHHTCHSSSALETYKEKTKVIDAFAPAAFVSSEMERIVRMLPRSKGPGRPPRVLILGARGSGVREHASRLASRLGAVFVDAERLQTSSSSQGSDGYPASRLTTSIDMPKDKLAAESGKDILGPVGVRLRHSDCKSLGFVMCGFVNTPEIAKFLASDVYLCPTRIVALKTSTDVCVARLRNLAYDKVTGKIWTYRPTDEKVRSRLQRKPEDMPSAVAAACEEFTQRLPGVLQVFGNDGKCLEVQADCSPEDTYSNVVEFVERPLPIGSS